MTLIINADDLPRFMTCNGSRLMPGSLPASTPGDTTLRDEGIAAHHMVTTVYRGQAQLEELVDRKAPNGVYMTVEMAGHVANYLEILKEHPPTIGGVEFDTSHDNSPYWAINGRADYASWSEYNRTIRIFDFKYGWKIVNPQDNWTLISHAIGLIAQNVIPYTRVVLSIYQPRPWHPEGPLRDWVLTPENLMALMDRINKTLCEPKDELRTSNHCTNCPALTTCPAATQAQHTAVDWIENHVHSDAIDNAQLKFQLDTLYRVQDMVKERVKAMEELAQHRIKAGQIVQGYAVDMAYHNTTWKEGMTADVLQMLTGHQLSAQPKLVTPAEAGRRGVNKELIKTLTERLPSGIKLVRADADKRAARLFKQEGK